MYRFESINPLRFNYNFCVNTKLQQLVVLATHTMHTGCTGIIIVVFYLYIYIICKFDALLIKIIKYRIFKI